MAQQWGDKAYTYAKAKEHGGPKEKEDWTQDSDQEERAQEYKERYEKMKGGLQKLSDLENVGEEYEFKEGDTLYEHVLQGFFKMKQRTAFFVMVRMLEHGINVDSWKTGDTVSVDGDGSLLWTRGEKYGKIENILEPSATAPATEDDEEKPEPEPEPADELPDGPAEPPPARPADPAKPPEEEPSAEGGDPPVVEPPRPPPPTAEPPATPPARPDAGPSDSGDVTPPIPAPGKEPDVSVQEKAAAADRESEERPAEERIELGPNKIKTVQTLESLIEKGIPFTITKSPSGAISEIKYGPHRVLIPGEIKNMPNVVFVLVRGTDRKLKPIQIDLADPNQATKEAIDQKIANPPK